MAIRSKMRGRIAVTAALASLALGLASCTGGAGEADATANTVEASLAESIEAAVQNAMELSGSTSAIVGVWQGEDAAYVQGFGDETTANDRFRAAQASQPVMCAALLNLVEQGRLSLDREISEDMPRQVGIDGITYGQLCTHTSGLADFKIGIADIFANNPTRQWSDRELTAQSLARSPLSWPGLDVHLSDSNALMLGRALRLGSGDSLHEVLRDNVFEPTGMASSYYPENPLSDVSLPSGSMTGYTYPLSAGAPVCDAGVTTVTEVSPSMLAGAGATVTTATDLKNFYESYLGGAFGSGSAELISTTVSTENPKRDENGEPLPPEEGAEPNPSARMWGFGLEQVGPLYGMSGSMTGTISAAYHDPATGFSVVVALNNSTAGGAFARALALQLAALAGEEVTWTAEDQGAFLAERAVCPPSDEAAAEG